MRKPTILMTLVGVSLLAFVSTGPVAAVAGWLGPSRVLADYYPLSPSMVLRGGVYHVAYFHEQGSGGDQPNGIFYATNDGGTWHKQRITTGDDFYARPSIAIDNVGFAHIAFTRACFACEPFESNIWLANNESGPWVVEQFTDGKQDLAASVAFSGEDLWVVYYRRGRGVFVARHHDSTWESTRAVSTIGKCPTLDVFPTIVVDSGGVPTIAYENPRNATSGCNPGTKGIRLIRPSEGPEGWATIIISTDTDDQQPKLALSANDLPHLIFERAGTGIEYTRMRMNGTWTPAAFAANGNDASLAVDANGKAHVGYESIGPWYATNKSGSWETKQLASFSLDFGTNSPVRITLTNTGKARVLFARAEGAGSEDDLGLYLAREQ